MSGCGESTREQWRRRMARFEGAGLSVVEFCLQEGISTPSFYQWRKRLAQEGGDEIGSPSSFRPVRLVGAAEVSVELPGGTRLRIPAADRQALEVVLGVLARVDADRVGSKPC